MVAILIINSPFRGLGGLVAMSLPLNPLKGTYKEFTSDVYNNSASDDAFSLIYDGNGSDSGSVPVDTNEYDEEDIVKVLGPGTLSRAGYYFSGWNTRQDGTGQSNTAGSVFIMSDHDVTFIFQKQIKMVNLYGRKCTVTVVKIYWKVLLKILTEPLPGRKCSAVPLQTP